MPAIDVKKQLIKIIHQQALVAILTWEKLTLEERLKLRELVREDK